MHPRIILQSRYITFPNGIIAIELIRYLGLLIRDILEPKGMEPPSRFDTKKGTELREDSVLKR